MIRSSATEPIFRVKKIIGTIAPSGAVAVTVTVDQSISQADPTSTFPIYFDVIFSQPVTGFTAADVVISGTAGATDCVVTGSGANYTVAVLAPRVSFCDDFERADGALGPNWELLPVTTDWYSEVFYLPTIEDGNAIVIEDSGGRSAPHETGMTRWATPSPGNQYIEACVQGIDYYHSSYPDSIKMFGTVTLFCQSDDDTVQHEELVIQWSYHDGASHLSLDGYWTLDTGENSDESSAWYGISPWAPYFDDPTICVRFECDADGATRIYFDMGTAGATTLVASGVSASGHTGPYVGFASNWGKFASSGHGGTSPRILWVCGGNP